MSAVVIYELRMFRSLANFLEALGLAEDRANVWARAAVERYRRARRRGVAAEHLFDFAHAEMYAAREARGCDPRDWI